MWSFIIGYSVNISIAILDLHLKTSSIDWLFHVTLFMAISEAVKFALYHLWPARK